MKIPVASRPELEKPSAKTFEEWEEYLTGRQRQPIEKASRKLFQFVNAAVGDPDFRHPQSQHLLYFLMLARDVLTDNINEHWTLDDILLPIMIEGKKRAAMHALEAKSEKHEKVRREVIAAWLAKPRGNGERDRFAAQMAEKYRGHSATTIRKSWLSKKSIDAYRAEDGI